MDLASLRICTSSDSRGLCKVRERTKSLQKTEVVSRIACRALVNRGEHRTVWDTSPLSDQELLNYRNQQIDRSHSQN